MKPYCPPALLCFVVLLGSLAVCPGESKISGDAWKRAREQAINRPRRIIFNNDGNEPVKECKTTSPAELLSYRTTALAGSQVDSIFYCTWSSGFGLFTHLTKVGQVFTSREGRFTNNLMPEFVAKGIDPLRVMVDFAHSNRMELFWSFRVNDTHDGSATDYGPILFRTNTLKQAHPEWLIGSIDKKPKHGVWSAVDFGVAEIRDLAFRYCEEVCRNYDVDGIELDFFRHAFLFKCSGRGQPCGETELNQMTSLLQRIRAMTEAEGKKRGRPILIAVRVPDSVEYGKTIGLDLENWLKRNLLDLLVVSGYTQLNPWEYSVKLGHKYGVKVYPSLDESRVKDESAKALRTSLETYRGRALNVWSSGADGVYVFNFNHDPHSPLWRDLGDPKVLRTLDRNYFASVRGVGSVPVPHQKFIRVPTLNPGSPISIAPGKTGSVEFFVGEDLSQLNKQQRAMLRLQFKDSPPVHSLSVTLNDHKLKIQSTAGWFESPVDESLVRSGNNHLSINQPPETKGSLVLTDLYVSIRDK